MDLAVVVLLASLVMAAYLYAGYPALLFLLTRFRDRPVRRGEVRPRITLIIPVFNEAEVIRDKLDNSAALEYPADRLEILVASDGSTDGTEEIVRRYPDADVRLLSLSRRGKAMALNDAVRAAGGEVLVFTDANSELRPDCLLELARNYADPEVGGVCGNKVLRDPGAADTTEVGEGLYWRYDKWQKGLESRLGSIFAADGALHSVRRDLYVPIEDPAQADDIAISTRVVLQGYRLIFEPRAVAVEDAPVEGADELRRKVRVTNHSVRALLNLGPALWTSGFYSVELLSHKLLRHLSPFFLLPLLLSSAWLAGAGPPFVALFLAQAVFYLLAAAGFLLRHTRPGKARVLTLPYYFTLVNVAAFQGVLSVLAGFRLSEWTPRGGLNEPGEPR